MNKYYIPVIGWAFYRQDVQNGEAFISHKTDLLAGYHIGCGVLLLVIVSIWLAS